VLDRAAYRSNTEKVDTVKVRLALVELRCILKDRRYLTQPDGSAGGAFSAIASPADQRRK